MPRAPNDNRVVGMSPANFAKLFHRIEQLEKELKLLKSRSRAWKRYRPITGFDHLEMGVLEEDAEFDQMVRVKIYKTEDDPALVNENEQIVEAKLRWMARRLQGSVVPAGTEVIIWNKGDMWRIIEMECFAELL